MSGWKVIEQKDLLSDTTEIVFSSIPQTFTDLVVLVSGRANPNEANGGVVIQLGFNGSYSDISAKWLAGTGSSVALGTDTTIYVMTSSNDSTGSTFGNTTIYIPSYRSLTAKSTSVEGISENNGVVSRQLLGSGLWNPSTQAAITSLSLRKLDGILTGTSVTLYGIKDGSSGGVTVS